MMTAMQASSLPAALLRSGRVELWLETRLPDDVARAQILRERISGLPEPLASVNLASITAAARGLTGADLKSVVEDAKLLFAHERSSGACVQSAERYFLEAIATIRKNRRSYSRRSRVEFGGAVEIGFRRY
jgi:transitional endoplasmic reticulum ATPase